MSELEHQPRADLTDAEGYSERIDGKFVPGPNRILIERHQPTCFNAPFHHHTSVEINFLTGCEMEYTFSGNPITIPSDRLVMFWGAAPHRVSSVNGKGKITNIYLSLGQFLRWNLPENLVEDLLSGCVICADRSVEFDIPMLDRMYSERNPASASWRQVHLSELETRLRRVGLKGWTVLFKRDATDRKMLRSSHSMLHVERMLRFLADNSFRQITAAEVVRAVNLSQGHATKLFRQVMGVTIKEQLTRMRLSHARMLLLETDQKIVTIALDSGFKSLSSFYEAFVQADGVSPGKYRRRARSSRTTTVQ